MIRFTRLTYKNFYSIGNHPISIELDRSPTTLIGGENGSGKSAMMSALTYGLFGKMLAGIKIGQAINSINKKNMLITVEFEVRGEEWKVVRGEKPKKFEIYRNDELLDRYANARDQQKFLEVILGMDFKLFTQVVVINKERYVPFMDMGAADRRKIVEDILGISIFSTMNDVTKQKIKSLKQDESNLDRDYAIKQTEIKGQRDLIAQIQKTIDEASSNLQSEIDSKAEQRKDLVDQSAEIESKMEAIDLSGHTKVKQRIREFESLSVDFTKQIKQAEQNLEFYTSNNECPTCSQTIDDELKEDKKQESQQQRDTINKTVTEMLGELEAAQKQNEHFEQLSQQWSDLSQQLQTTTFQISSIDSDIKGLEDKQAKATEDTELDSYIDDYDALEAQLEDIGNQLRQVSNDLEMHERVRELLKDDGIKSLIVQEYNAIINRYVNEYLNAMQFYVNMTIDENFKETFHSMNREGFTYANLSTGQKTRVNIAITLALLEVASIKNSITTNIICLDELLEPIDAVGIKDIMSLFKEKLSSKHVFCITQRFDEFEGQFESAIQFKLEQGFTEIA